MINMLKDMFSIYSAIVILAFATASYKGYAFNSLLTAARHSSAQQNQYHK